MVNVSIQCAHQTFIGYQYIYIISTYFFDIRIVSVGGKDLSFCVGPQAPFINKNASEEEKMLGKAS